MTEQTKAQRLIGTLTGIGQHPDRKALIAELRRLDANEAALLEVANLLADLLPDPELDSDAVQAMFVAKARQVITRIEAERNEK